MRVSCKPLPETDGTCSGDVKFVYRKARWGRHGAVLLIIWSPPHVLRGIPSDELLLFFWDAINDEREWRGISGEDKNNSVVKYNCSRNMYDADQYMIRPLATRFDSSYAEIATHYGPPTVFISHVWGETAYKTYCGLSKLWENHLDDVKIGSVRSVRSSGAASVIAWFCVTCNNQGRIAEELGEDILLSPFSQVFSLRSIKAVALVSPLRALVRKWCTFEFSIAVANGLDTLMVTHDGTIQKGQVPPEFLRRLAEKLTTFSCKDATCFNQMDAVRIDAAIAARGGWTIIDNQLKHIFRKAIDEAHAHVTIARDLIKDVTEAPQPVVCGRQSATHVTL